MNAFEYTRPANTKAAVDAVLKQGSNQFLAGGTNLIDLMKRNVVVPAKLVDINRLPLQEISASGGKLKIGALALNSDVSEHRLVTENHLLLSMALKAGASPQLRNMATVGGNMMQRTRCAYFYDTEMPCNKRKPGSGCGAAEGYNRMHAIFGTSAQCIAVHPSDMCVALAALDAVVTVSGPKGERKIAFADFHRLPGENPEKDNTLQKGELILSVELPESRFGRHVHYLKVRDRTSYAFALVSVAAALQMENNTIKEARLAMGGVAHKPWRLKEAEQFLAGKKASDDNFRKAAELGMQGAKAFKHNQFKLKMAPVSIVEALTIAAKA